MLPSYVNMAGAGAARAALYAEERAKALGRGGQDARRSVSSAWYDDPVALGSLLIILPPIGLAALWSSKRYSHDARWALTIMTALTLCLGAAVTVTILALRG
jgi:hypothetical protein